MHTRLVDAMLDLSAVETECRGAGTAASLGPQQPPLANIVAETICGIKVQVGKCLHVLTGSLLGMPPVAASSASATLASIRVQQNLMANVVVQTAFCITLQSGAEQRLQSSVHISARQLSRELVEAPCVPLHAYNRR